eukprot:TRINITY_DN1769_c0_g1_i1.p3 TRINITY_DN1769_c0_g1~~TRINITY_DN1769_c0_g1_i1.p3  ORF type:complete len:191 (+),score=36.10 TRINITY_DN1769_c0_g1_i1:204-776(+)
MAGVLKSVDEKFDHFMRNREDIKKATQKCFVQADVNNDGVLEMKEVINACDAVVETVRAPLEEYGIQLSTLSEDQIYKIVQQSDLNHDQKLDINEFEEFYVKLLKLMAAKFLTGFSKKYGLGIIAGIVGVAATKSIVKAIPVAGAVVSPILPLIPAGIVGPLLGVAVTFGLEKGDLMAAKKKLFPAKKEE